MTHDMIVIGGGSAGLTAAGGAAMFGLKVALIEAGAMGGECLNTGCVPSKALIAAAARAQAGREGDRLGVTLGPPRVDFAGVRAHVRGAIDHIAPDDSQERFEAMGVEVIRATARFTGRKTVLAGNRTLGAPRIVIATGARPAIPDITGLADTPFLTNETLWDIESLPGHLIVIGGGPIGIEMAQAFRRLGSEVTVIDRAMPLGAQDADAAALVIDRLRAEGVAFETDANIAQVAGTAGAVRVTLAGGREIAGSHVLVAAGRRANIESLGLDTARVRHGEDGIIVDAARQTSNVRIFAIGDCRAGPRFTHAGGHEGSLVALSIALNWTSKADWSALPRVTYCDPELAQIGMTEQEARDRYGSVDVIREAFADNDRAVAEGDTTGFLKLVRRGRKVVGVTIVGRGAGELLLPWAQVVAGKASTFALASAIIAYPTRGEISKAAAFAAHEATVFGVWPKRWAKLVARTRRWLT